MEQYNNDNNDIIKHVFMETMTNKEKKRKEAQNKKAEENTQKEDKLKERVVCQRWTFSLDQYKYESQLETIHTIYNNQCCYISSNLISKTMVQEINRKIYGYKHQDLLKHKYNENDFITLESILRTMVQCSLLCYYCNQHMDVLYCISREGKQWSVDRINNQLGHNKDNFYLACLECNLKRRCRNDDKFLFTKQLKIVKVS
jgi:hypothetical protein